MKLLPCPSCSRHLKPEETACPFCGVRRETKGGGWIAPVAAALVTAAMVGIACKDDPPAVPPYGIPPMIEDAGGRDAGIVDAAGS